MNDMKRKRIAILNMMILLIGILILGGCQINQAASGVQTENKGKEEKIIDTTIQVEEEVAIHDILSNEEEIENITENVFEVPLGEKFPAVKKVFKMGEEEYDYAFLVSPVGYQGPIDMMIVIDGEKKMTVGIKILHHHETPEYAEYLTQKWFTDRFKDKMVDPYLERAVLEAERSNEIVQITGSTVSSQAAINGVNAAMGVFREIVLGEKAEAVPLNVLTHVTANES